MAEQAPRVAKALDTRAAARTGDQSPPAVEVAALEAEVLEPSVSRAVAVAQVWSTARSASEVAIGLALDGKVPPGSELLSQFEALRAPGLRARSGNRGTPRRRLWA